MSRIRKRTFYKTPRRRALMQMAERAIVGKLGEGTIRDGYLLRFALLFTAENWNWAKSHVPDWRVRITTIEAHMPLNGTSRGFYELPRTEENEALLEQVSALTQQPVGVEALDMALLFLTVNWEVVNRRRPEWKR